MTERRINVCAIVVTYRPDATRVAALFDALRSQVGGIVVIDNSGSAWQAGASGSPADVSLIALTHNVGLAAAQNLGIEWAREQGYSHVLLLDQDSEPEKNMVNSLCESLERLSSVERVGAVGPKFHDLREQRDAPFVRIRFPASRKLWCEHSAQTIACDFLISSGMLIPLTVLDEVGLMDAGLFIDNVDLEWSFRARSLGYSLHGVCAATMHHRLGDARRKLPFGLGQVVIHGPVRLYYMMRNRVLLYQMQHTPRSWVAQDVPRVLIKLFLFGVMIGPRGRNMRCMLRGLRDGARGDQNEAPADFRASP